MNPFGDGSQGALNVTSGITYLPLNTKLQYTTVNVGASGTIRPSGTTGSVLYICATESITINGTINVRDIVNYGNNTWGVIIDGETFTSPGVANGGDSHTRPNVNYGKQNNGFGGGGTADVGVDGGKGGNGGLNPSGGGGGQANRNYAGTAIVSGSPGFESRGGGGNGYVYIASGAPTGAVFATAKGGNGGASHGSNGSAGSGSGGNTGGWSGS